MSEQQHPAGGGSEEGWRDRLARLLSRMAALQGHAVPWHRFAMASQATGGATLNHLDAMDLAVEWWRTRFPAGSITPYGRELPQGAAPALWVSSDPTAPGGGMLIARGVLSAGALSCLDVNGAVIDLPAAIAARGQLLGLKADVGVEAFVDGERSGSELPGRSASEWFRHAIQKRWGVFVEGAVATMTLNVVALTTSFYSMQVYDRVVPTGGYSTLWVLTIGVAIAIVVELLMRQVRGRMVDRACKAIDEELSSVFFGHALAIRMDKRPRTVGTFAAQIRHFEMVRNFMTSTTLFVFADAPFALLFVAVIAFIAGPVAIVPLAFIPLAVLVGDRKSVV